MIWYDLNIISSVHLAKHYKILQNIGKKFKRNLNYLPKIIFYLIQMKIIIQTYLYKNYNHIFSLNENDLIKRILGDNII